MEIVQMLEYFFLPLIAVATSSLSFVIQRKKSNRNEIALLLLTFSILSIIGQSVVSWRRDVEAEREQEDLQVRVDDMKEKNDEYHDDLIETKNQLSYTRSELAVANSNLLMQSRSIGSLVYNMETSSEGKQRFVRCVEALSFLDAKSEYQALVCDDGVAVFRFQAETGVIAGFYFYANSEINEVLSGIPVGKNLEAKNGRLLIAQDSELAMLMERALERRMPAYGNDEMSRRIALDCAQENMRIFFRYVYRAEKYNCGVTRPFGWHVAFHYSVSPARIDSCDRIVELWMNEVDVVSLCGLTQKEFSERMLTYCRQKNVLPKIHAKDIECLEKGRKRKADVQSFPYSRERVLKLQ